MAALYDDRNFLSKREPHAEYIDYWTIAHSDKARLSRREPPTCAWPVTDLHKLATTGHRVEDAGKLGDDIAPCFPAQIVQPFRLDRVIGKLGR